MTNRKDILRELKKIKKLSFKGYAVEVKPVRPKDLIYLRNSRNAVEIKKQMVDDSYITPSKQRSWYQSITTNDCVAYWVVWQRGHRVGSMNIKLIKNKIDVGMYVWSRKIKNGLIGISIALVQLDIVFYHLSLNSIETSPKTNNRKALMFNEKLGYTKIKENEEFTHIKINKNNYELNKVNFDKYFKGCNNLEIKKN